MGVYNTFISCSKYVEVVREDEKLRTRISMTRTYLFVVALLGVSALSLVACGGEKQVQKPNKNVQSGLVTASAVLKYLPSGIADLAWKRTSHELSLKLSMKGLVPKSVHGVSIQQGNCSEAGKELYTLKDVAANDLGMVSSTASVRNVAQEIPATGWSLLIGNSRNLSPEKQKQAIACGEIANKEGASEKGLQVSLASAALDNQAVRGIVQLHLLEKQLNVAVSAINLEKKKTYKAEIATGSCAQPGKKLYDLAEIKADTHNNGTATTVIKDVSTLPDKGWYVRVYQPQKVGGNQSVDQIACGDVLIAR